MHADKNSVRRIQPLILIVLAAGLVLVGPDWPTRATDLICGASVDQVSVRSRFPDMNACMLEMDDGCFCSVRETWLGAIYYLGLLPFVLIASVWLLSHATARGMGATYAVLGTVLLVPWVAFVLYGLGFSIPRFAQTMAVFWPQQVFFGTVLFGSRGLVVPHAWSYTSMVLFWAVASAIFGAAARRLTSFPLLLVFAGVFVAAMVRVVRLIVPLLGWRLMFEGP